MNTTDLIERLRAADEIEVENVDALISGAVRQGRRRRVRQRVLPALVGVLALVTAVGLAGILAVRDGRSSGPVAVPTTTVSPSATPEGPTSDDVLSVVRTNLPEDMSVVQVDLWKDPQANEGWNRQAVVLMTLDDADGPARAEADLYHDLNPRNGCTREGHCRRIRVGGKTFYEFIDWKTRNDVRLYDVGTYYERPDGLVTSFQQHNFVDHEGPATRPTLPVTEGEGWPVTPPTLPLSEAEVQALLTAPEWDALAARCQPEVLRYC